MKIKTINQLLKNKEAATKVNQLVLGIVLSFELDAPVEDTILEILPDVEVCTNLIRDMISLKEIEIEDRRQDIHQPDLAHMLQPEMELMGSLAML